MLLIVCIMETVDKYEYKNVYVFEAKREEKYPIDDVTRELLFAQYIKCMHMYIVEVDSLPRVR